jgi:ABC-2 type transport system permease protein
MLITLLIPTAGTGRVLGMDVVKHARGAEADRLRLRRRAWRLRAAPSSAYAPIALVVLVAAFSCTGLGLVNAAVSLRIRENAVLSNVIFGFLPIFTGANVPLDDLPSWMSTAAQGMPFTHAIEAARDLVAGSTLGDVSGLVGAELLIGVIYGVAGYALLRWFEIQSRRHATLDRS